MMQPKDVEGLTRHGRTLSVCVSSGPMQEGKVTRLWTRASASLPLGWRLAGVMRRELAPQCATNEDEWLAVALESDRTGSITGTGTSPEQALGNLAESLRRMRGNPRWIAAASVLTELSTHDLRDRHGIRGPALAGSDGDQEDRHAHRPKGEHR